MLQDERLIELISGSLDDALSSEETAELEAGLAASAGARELMEELRLDHQAVRALPRLETPANLKLRALLKVKAEASALGRPWQRAVLLAASVALVAGVFYQFRPIKALALHLNPGRMAMRADAISDELHLAAAGNTRSHVMISENVSAKHIRGRAISVHLRCDAGNAPGGQLAVKLHFDFDGDGHVDLHTPAHTLQVDGAEGYQELVCVIPPMEGMQDLNQGTVHLEVACETGPPLKVKLDPEQARVELPFEDLTG